MKNYLPFIILILSGWNANCQSVQFPKAKAGGYEYFMYINENWTPTARFIQINPKILTTGEFSFNDTKGGFSANDSKGGGSSMDDLKHWNSNSYPAVFAKNNNSINLPGRIFVLFNGDEMPDIDGAINSKQPNGIDYIPLFDAAEDKYYSDKSCKIYSNEANYSIDVKYVRYPKEETYAQLNSVYQSDIKKEFTKKGVSNATVLPLASFNLSKEDIKPTDLIFEFSIDGVWTQVTGIMKEAREKEFDFGVLYKLTIRDCAGKILKTYGQTVFGNLSPGKAYYRGISINNEMVLFGHTYVSAIECLLNQYTADNDLKQSIIKRTTALKIQAASDKSFIQLFKLKAEANHYRHCEMNIINGINELNEQIIQEGGSGIDLSGTTMPTNSNPAVVPQATYNMGASLAAAGAGIFAAIDNAAAQAKIRQLKGVAENLKAKFPEYVAAEEKAVDAYNKLLESTTITDVNLIGNPGLANGNNNAQGDNNFSASKTTDLEDFWGEGQPKSSAQKSGATRNNTAQNTSSANNQSNSYERNEEQPDNNTRYYEESNEPITKKSPASTPVYHKVLPKETLYRLALENGVTIDDLKNWNDLRDGLQAGMNLIVGYTSKSNITQTSWQSDNNYSNDNEESGTYTPSKSVSYNETSNTNNQQFWDEDQGSSANPGTRNSTSSVRQNSSSSLKPMSTSSDLENQFNDADESISQSAEQSVSSIQAKSAGSKAWTESTVSSYAPPKADKNAISSENGGGATAGGGTDLATQCPEGERIINQMTARCSKYASISGEQSMYKSYMCQANVIREAMNACKGKASPQELAELQKAITVLENAANNSKQNQGGSIDYR